MDWSNEIGQAGGRLSPSEAVRRPPRYLFPISGLVAFNVTFARQITSKRASSPAQVCVSMCLAAPARGHSFSIFFPGGQSEMSREIKVLRTKSKIEMDLPPDSLAGIL